MKGAAGWNCRQSDQGQKHRNTEIQNTAWRRDLLREGDREMAEQYVKKAMARFAKTAYDNWVAHGKRS
jgi:hypothetical protein